ncbi:MAG: inositol monophosphatase family protein [Streptosporangiaceae bacterium]
MSAPDAGELLTLAAKTAAAAARLLADEGAQARPEVVETKSSLTDVVTEMDRRAEALITEQIRAARPGDAILGEEGGETHGAPAPGQPGGAPAAEVRWIVDPLDGTVNYLYGLSDWAVSIAAEVAGTIVAGVVAVPLHGETFLAVRGQGAWRRTDSGLHSAVGSGAVRSGAVGSGAVGSGPGGSGADGDTALRCNRGVPLGQALVGTGFGYLPGRRRVQGEVVSALLPQIRDIRRGGSASVDLCMVAAGRLDAFYERGLNYWDYAAGALIAAEAGARVTGLAGRPPGSSMTVAAGPGLYEQLTGALAALSPERDA